MNSSRNRTSPFAIVHTLVTLAAALAMMPLVVADGPTGGGGKLDLRLKSPRSTVGIEGTWLYSPLDGSAPYRIEIRATQGGFYEFQGTREGQSRPILELDRAEGAGYRGEVADGFDPCVGAGARFALFPSGDRLVFEPALPVSGPFTPTLPGPCTSARHYYLTARGHGDQIRIKPPEEVTGVPSPYTGDTRDPRGTNDSRDAHGRKDTPGATVTLGAPTAPDGTEVVLLGSLRDAARKLWHHVRLIGPTSESLEEARDAEATAPAGGSGDDAEATAKRPSDERQSGAPGEREGRPATGQGGQASDPAAGKSDPARAAGSATGKNGKGSRPKPEGPVTGYVAAESVVVRWECRLERSGAEGAREGAR